MLHPLVTLPARFPRNPSSRRRPVATTAVFFGLAVALLTFAAARSASAHPAEVVLEADFAASNDGFTYVELNDPSGPSYVDGDRGAGVNDSAVRVELGGVDNADIYDMAGGWQRPFTMADAAPATITFSYRIRQTEKFETNEFGEARLRVDGAEIAPAGGFPRLAGDNKNGGERVLGWNTYEVDVNLAAGSHTLTLVGFSNAKTYNDETTWVEFDDVTVTAHFPEVPTATPTPQPAPTSTPLPTAIPTPIPTPLPTPIPGGCGGGPLAQQAEAGQLNGTIVEIVDPRAFGSSYLQAEVGSRGRPSASDDFAEYCFTVPAGAGGEYRLDATVLAPTNADDSFWVAVDDGPLALWDMAISASWVVDSVSNRNGADPVVYPLAEGDHVLRVYQREDGAAIDRFEFVPLAATCRGLAQEAELGVARGSMIVAAGNGASGGAYVIAEPGTNGRQPGSDDYVEFCAIVPAGQDGTYRLDLRVLGTNSGDDSFYVTVDGATESLFDFARSAAFTVDSVAHRSGADPVLYPLAAGEHMVRIYQREDGAAIDSIEFVPVVVATPTPIPTATPAPTATPLPSPTPLPGFTFHADANFGGASQSFTSGTYSSAAGLSTVGDNQASSFEITPGWMALVCTNGDGTGTCRGFTNSKNNLGAFSLNNNLSYLQIRGPGEAFRVVPGNDLDQFVNRLPGAVDFVLEAGVHSGHNMYVKDDMTFTGEPGAILDGGGSGSPAFSGVGDRVEIRNLEIRGYAVGEYVGAISARDVSNFSREGVDWIVDNNLIHHNGGAGVNAGSGMSITNNEIHTNKQIGISGIGSTQYRLANVTVADNYIHHNNPSDGFPFTYHEGGLKFTETDNANVHRNRVEYNRGMAIYCDVACDGFWVDDNIMIENGGRRNGGGVFIEISRNGRIKGNIIDGKGENRNTWWGGLMVGESHNVLVEDNDVRIGHAYGMGLRGCCNRPASTNVTFRNNSITATDGEVRAGFDGDAYQGRPVPSTISLENNRYYHDGGTIRFTKNGAKSWSWWQGEGYDRNGSYNP